MRVKAVSIASAAASLSALLSWVMPWRVSAIASAPPVRMAAAARTLARRCQGRRVLGAWGVGVWGVVMVRSVGD